MYTVLDELEYIYNRIIDNNGCVALHLDGKGTEEDVNLCSQAGYGGKPALIVVPDEKWMKVVYLMEFPELYSESCKKAMSMDKNLRKQFIDNAQDARINWLINHRDEIFREACKILGVPYTKANETPYNATTSTTPEHSSTRTTSPSRTSPAQPEPTKPDSEEDYKPPHKSKTVWFGIATIIAGILSKYFHYNVSPGEVLQYIGFLIILFRMWTHKKIKI